jgi:DNA-binding MurR/RpiR family transcriptional regulator
MIILETFMTKQSSKTNSTSILQTADAQSARPIHINVKAAAKRLGVSTSTVYRLDREHGPIRFLSTKRPIAVDLVSLETHLTHTGGIELEPDFHLDEERSLSTHKEKVEQIHSDAREVPVVATPSAPTSDPASLVTWCGPREPFIPRRGGPFVIFYGFSE